jgi:hypothetical protein
MDSRTRFLLVLGFYLVVGAFSTANGTNRLWYLLPFFAHTERIVAVSLDSVLPPQGPLAGGNNVTLIGTFISADITSVSLGSTAATILERNDTVVIVRANLAGTAGTVSVTVFMSSGDAVLAASYTYNDGV